MSLNHHNHFLRPCSSRIKEMRRWDASCSVYETKEVNHITEANFRWFYSGLESSNPGVLHRGIRGILQKLLQTIAVGITHIHRTMSSFKTKNSGSREINVQTSSAMQSCELRLNSKSVRTGEIFNGLALEPSFSDGVGWTDRRNTVFNRAAKTRKIRFFKQLNAFYRMKPC